MRSKIILVTFACIYGGGHLPNEEFNAGYFTRLFLQVESKVLLSLLFCFVAFLSAFLDALTVTAVLIGVGIGFYRIFHLQNRVKILMIITILMTHLDSLGRDQQGNSNLFSEIY